MSPEYYVDVILPLPLGKLYTYKVPAGDVAKCAEGIRVIVQFGKQKLYTGIVRQIHNNAPEGYRPKEILEVLDDAPVVTSNQLELWEWMASYYLCTLGDVMNAALPAAMKIQSETVVGLVPDNASEGLILTPEEELVIQELKSGSQLSVSEVASVTGVKNPMPMIRRLIEKGVLVLSEEITEDFSRRLVDFVRMSDRAENDDAFMREIFEKLEKRAPKQLDLLMHFMRMKQDSRDLPIRKNQLLRQSGITAPVLEQLVSKGVLEVYSELESHAFASATGSEQQVELSEVQMEAYNTITDSFHGDKPVVLHGVTSSGKTEVYIRLINDAIGSGKQVLYLLPEIALTTQILGRLKSHFGEQMLVYHSRHSAKERSEVYMKVLQDGREGQLKFPLVIGARSAVFLPFLRPGLIIVDEEHDSSYKQMDPAPRYNARDVAVAVSRMWGSRALLGSATPSLESYYNAESGKYDLVRMTQRYGGMKMPAIEMVDLRDAYAKGGVKSGFSMRLRELIQSALSAGEQVILFQNRRGFAPVLECRNCGWIPQCVNCDVSLTYHKRSDQLKCHYCGYSTHVPGACKACEHTDIRMKGLGTERIEDDVQTLFPAARVQRLDLDTTTSKHSFQRILESFSSREIDILVGTQMVTKGLDFDNVSVVGVLSADHLIGFPDFRAAERSFQLLAQVAGRAGRKFRQGKVVVQAYNITHPIFQYLVSNDYPGFYRNECSERERFGYPPFTRLVELRLRHRDERQLEMLAGEFAKMLRAKFGKRVLGPVPPPVARVRNFYIRQVLLKVEKGYSDKQLKTAVRDITARFLSIPDYRSLLIQADVDPM